MIYIDINFLIRKYIWVYHNLKYSDLCIDKQPVN